MSYKTKFLIFIIVLHLAEIALSIIVLNANKTWFIASEAIILASIIFSIFFWVSFTKPLKLINTGVESLKDKDFNIRLVKVGQTDIDNIIDVFNQMLTRLRHERKLMKEQHLFLEHLIQASPAGIIIFALDEKIQIMNPAAEVFLAAKTDDLIGLPLSAINSVFCNELAQIGLNQTSIIQSSGIQKFKVHKSYFVNHGFRNHFLIVEELSNEIYQAELAAYEKVIRTISHEFNNSVGPINSILNSLRFYTKQLSSTDQTEYENAIGVAIDRNNVLNVFVKRYAEVFKLPPPIMEQCNVNDVVNRMVQLFHHEFMQRNIQIILNISNTPALIRVDINQFELVVSNILRNAMEAIDNDGEIAILTTSSELTIRNNGQPISIEIQKKIFSPFFSTKKNGQGIGLTIVREVLHNHNFSFSLKTISERLTEFRINFAEIKTQDKV